MSRTVAIVQARMGSRRLPDKVLADIAGQPMLVQVVRRVRRARTIDEVVVATSVQPQDDAIAALCAREGITCVRGSENDVLDRYYQAARTAGADVVVRITADCPLHDPAVIDRVVRAYAGGGADYVSNTMPYTYPDGLDVEVFSMAALRTAWREADKPSEREHVTPFLRTSGRFHTANVEREVDLSPFNYRWTVDEPADLEFARLVYTRLADRPSFGLEDVLGVLAEMPSLREHEGQSIRNEGYYRTLLDQAVAAPAAPRPDRVSRAWHQGVAAHLSVDPLAPVLSHADGCRVWDLDGNEYIDCASSMGATVLGYANPRVAEWLVRRRNQASPPELLAALADRLHDVMACGEAFWFGRSRGEAIAAVAAASRAVTGRRTVVYWGVPGPAGDPTAVRCDDGRAYAQAIAELDAAVAIVEPASVVAHGGDLAAVVAMARGAGALCVFDEHRTAFRVAAGGAVSIAGVTPDALVLGETLANGAALSAVAGGRELLAALMDRGVVTVMPDGLTLATALAVLDTLGETDAARAIGANALRLQEGLAALAKHAGLAGRIGCDGWPACASLSFRDATGTPDATLQQLFSQETRLRGLLVGERYDLSLAHDDGVVERMLEICAASMKTIAAWLAAPSPERYLASPPT